MLIKNYNDPQNFWQDTSIELRKEEAKNSLILGLSYTFKTEPQGCVFQSSLTNNNELLGSLVVSQYLGKNNLLPSPLEDSAYAQKLLQNLLDKGVKLDGLVSELNTSEIYIPLLESYGFTVKRHMAQGIYRCQKVKLPEGSPQMRFRLATLKDVELIGRWIEEFQNEALPHDPPIIGESVARAKINQKMIHLIEKKDEPVSMAAWSRDIQTSCSVNLVYTPKLFRKNGYGSIVTALLTQKLLDQGKKETNLYTDLANPTSNKIYQDLGYEFICHSVHHELSN